MIKRVRCVSCRPVSRHNLLQRLDLSLINAFLPLCSQSTPFSINIDDKWTLGRTHAGAGVHALTGRPADHRDLISCCHNTFIPHLSLGAVMSKRLLSAAKWQSGLLSVFSFSLMESDGVGLGHLCLCPHRRDFCPQNSPVVSSP